MVEHMDVLGDPSRRIVAPTCWSRPFERLCLMLLLTVGCTSSSRDTSSTRDTSAEQERSSLAAVGADTGCRQPSSEERGQARAPVAPGSLAGAYVLTLIERGGDASDAVISGRLELDTAVRFPKLSPHSRVSYPLSGHTDLHLAELGSLTLAHSPASRDPSQPGVQVLWDSTASIIRIILGNTATPQRTAVDAGVSLDVLDVSRTKLTGWWQSMGRTHPQLAGYFCATRVED